MSVQYGTHSFVAFLAYCLHVTLRARLKPLAPGLTSRAVLDNMAAVQMLDVHFPTTQIGHFLSNPVIRKPQLRPPHLNHAASSQGGARWGRGAANRD